MYLIENYEIPLKSGELLTQFKKHKKDWLLGRQIKRNVVNNTPYPTHTHFLDSTVQTAGPGSLLVFQNFLYILTMGIAVLKQAVRCQNNGHFIFLFTFIDFNKLSHRCFFFIYCCINWVRKQMRCNTYPIWKLFTCAKVSWRSCLVLQTILFTEQVEKACCFAQRQSRLTNELFCMHVWEKSAGWWVWLRGSQCR